MTAIHPRPQERGFLACNHVTSSSRHLRCGPGTVHRSRAFDSDYRESFRRRSPLASSRARFARPRYAPSGTPASGASGRSDGARPWECAVRELNQRKTVRACGLTPFGRSGRATSRVQLPWRFHCSRAFVAEVRSRVPSLPARITEASPRSASLCAVRELNQRKAVRACGLTPFGRSECCDWQDSIPVAISLLTVVRRKCSRVTTFPARVFETLPSVASRYAPSGN